MNITKAQRKVLKAIYSTDNSWPAEPSMSSPDCQELIRLGLVALAPSEPEDLYTKVTVTPAGIGVLTSHMRIGT